MKPILIALACLIFVTGCTVMPPKETMASPTASLVIQETPASTSTPTKTPRSKPIMTLTPSPTPLSPELPPELGEKTQSFPKNITPVGCIYDATYMHKPEFYISISMAYRKGKWMDAAEFSYGNPPIPAMDYIDYLNEKYKGVEQPDPYETPNYDPDDYYLESEILHRDMAFYVYDGSTCLGTGRIAKKPEFLTYYHEVFISAEFKMDDPTIILGKDKSYLALMGQWNPYPSKPAWNEEETEFSIDIDGNGTKVKGVIYEMPQKEDPDQTIAYVDITFRGKIFSYDLGNPDLESKYKHRFGFCDYDGNGSIEIDIHEEYEGGWASSVLSFTGKKPKTLINQGGRY